MAIDNPDLIFNDNDISGNNGISDVTNPDKVIATDGDIGSVDENADESVDKNNQDKGKDKPTDDSPSKETDSNSKDTKDGDDTNGDNSDTEGKDTKDEGKDTKDDKEDDDSQEVEDVVVNENGDLVDSDGKILAKKGQFTIDGDDVILHDDAPAKILEEEDKNLNLVLNQLKTDFDIELNDEEGNPITFDLSTPKGVSNLVATAGKAYHDKQLTELFNELPRVKSYLDHIVAGGDDRSFFNPSTNFNSITIPEDTDSNKESNKLHRRSILVTKNLYERGAQNLSGDDLKNAQKEVNDYVDYLFDKGIAKEKADSALAWLKSYETKENEARDAANQKAIEDNRNKIKEYWDDVHNIVSTGDIENITIPKGDRQAFYDYMSKPVGNTGKSQSQIDAEGEQKEKYLMLQYLRFKKFNLDDYIEARAKTQNAKKLRLMSSKSNNKKRGGKTFRIRKTNVNLDNISIQNLSQQK